MAKDNVIGLAMGLDVTDLKAGINEVKKLVKQSKDEFNVATAGLDKWTKSSDGLTAKLKQLDKQLDAQNKAVAGYKAEIERVSQLEGDHSIQLEQLKSKLQKAEIEVKKTESSIAKYNTSLSQVNAENKKAESTFGKLTDEIEKQKAELSELEYEYKDAVITYGKNSKEAKALEKQITSLNGELQDNQNEVKKADKQLENLEKQFDDTEEEAADFGSAIDNIKGLGGAVAKGIGAIGATVGGLATAFFATAESTKELRTNMGKIGTAFETAGLSAEQATDTYKNLYAVVADEGKATEATSHIAKLAKSQEDLQKWTEICTGVYATFGDSLPIENLAEASNETAKTGKITGGLADALNWAGKSEEEFQASLDKCSNEQERNKLITETLNGLYSEASEKYKETNKDVIESNKAQAELSDTMADLGAKAEPLLTTIKDGFNKVLQAVIELINGADFEGIKAGIESAFQYFIDTIIPAIVDGFNWIIDNKDTLIAGIVAIGTGMLAWNVVSIIQGVVTAIKGWMVATEGLTLAQKLLNIVLNANPIGIVISLIAGLVAGFVLLWNKSDAFRQFWIDLWEGLKKAVGVVVDWIKANWQALLLFMVNPVAGVFKYLYDNFEGFREIVHKVLNAIKNFFSNLWKDIKKIWGSTVDWFKNIGSKIADGFKSATSKVKDFFSNTWNAIKNVWSIVISWFVNIGTKISNGFKTATNNVKNYFVNTWNNIKKVWNVVISWFSNIATKLVNAFKSIPSKIKTYFSNAWNNVKKIWSTVSGWFANIATKLVNAFKNIPSKIKTFFVNAWNNVKSAWSNPTKFFNDVKDKIINAFKTLPSKMSSIGSDLVKGLWNGIKDMTSWVIGKIKGFTGDVLGGIKKFFGIHSPSKEMAKIGKFLDEGLAQGIEKNKNVVKNATDNLGKELLGSLSGIEKQIENKKLAEKLVALGGKTENPFKGWTHAQLNEESVELESTLANINKQIIDNGIVQEQWGSSSDKMIERAKLLEERYTIQLKLLDIYNQKLKYYESSGVETPKWVEDNLNTLTAGLETTLNEYEELNEAIDNQTEKTTESFVDKFEKALGINEKQMDSWTDKIGNELSKMVDYFEQGFNALGNLGSEFINLYNQSIDNEIQGLDRELSKFNKVKDAEIEKQEELFEKGLITEQELANAKATIEEEKRVQEEETLKKKNELAEKQFNAQKANDIAQATIQGALAIVKGFAELGPIAGAINAGVQAGITAVQIGTIASQKFVPMLAKGGIVDGATLAMIGENGKEAVVPLENNTGWIREIAEKLSEIMQKDFSFGVNQNLVPAYAGNTTINNYYTQNITAPKSPSRIELYRDTKNLLSLKGV